MPRNATTFPSGETEGSKYWPDCVVNGRRSPSSGTRWRSSARSRSHVSYAAPWHTTPDESASQAGPPKLYSPGVRSRGASVPSAGTT